MKRNVILLLASGLLLASCSGEAVADKTPIKERRNAESTHNTYLVLSKVGQYEGATVKEKDDTLFLENFVEFKADAGAALPGKDAITASSGAKFAGWVSYEGTGALTFYDKVPEENNKILYAYFDGIEIEGGGEVTPTPTPTPTPATAKYGIRNVDSGAMICELPLAEAKDPQGRDQAEAHNVAFTAGTKVQLWDTENEAGWVMPIEGWSFGGTSATDTKYAEYLTVGDTYWTVVQDFTAKDIYAKFAMGNDSIYIGL